MDIPSCYVEGHEAARKVDAEAADTYIRYTTIGDPAADAVVRELSEKVDPSQVHTTIAKTLDIDGDPPADTPQSLRNLVAEAEAVPEWFDPAIALVGTKAFLRNSDLVLAALVGGAIVEGFATTISRSFRIRGRITLNGVHRLKQNMLQLVEQFMPGGLEPGGDGWRLTLRVRLVHAQVRTLIGQSPEWDSATHGVPLSAAHMLLGAAAFSGRMMHHVTNLGGDFSEREREAYCHVWRYTSLLLGIPKSLIFTDLASSLRAFEIASICEPPADDNAIIMANSIINSAPILLGYDAPAERRSTAALLYQVSRELIGDEMADQLRYPEGSGGIGKLRLLRWKNVATRTTQRFFPGWRARSSLDKLGSLLDVSNLEVYEHSYALPTTIYDEDSTRW